MIDNMMPHETILLLNAIRKLPKTINCTATDSHHGPELRLPAKHDEDKGDSFASPLSLRSGNHPTRLRSL
jgi:hypothetical protein